MEWIFVLIVVYLLYRVLAQHRPKEKKRRYAFKKLYDLDRVQPIDEFERKMIDGMHREGREVFVTAFVRDGYVLRVTATIGSKFACHPSDDVTLWGQKARDLGATRIRQYHNHPDIFGRSWPSRQDKLTHRTLKAEVEG